MGAKKMKIVGEKAREEILNDNPDNANTKIVGFDPDTGEELDMQEPPQGKPMDYRPMTARFFLELINEKFGEDSETARSITEELNSKESVLFAHLPESRIETITFHENEPDSGNFYLSGTLSVPFSVYRKK